MNCCHRRAALPTAYNYYRLVIAKSVVPGVEVMRAIKATLSLVFPSPHFEDLAEEGSPLVIEKAVVPGFEVMRRLQSMRP